MKKYITLLLIFITITTSAAIGGPPPSCFAAVNPKLQEKFKITFQDVLNDPGKYGNQWADFKKDSRSSGSWDAIVNACCPQCSVQDQKCLGCSCNPSNECMWSCKCCWVEGIACGKAIEKR